MVSPANGCWPANDARSMPRTGIARSAHAIPGWPARASPGSATTVPDDSEPRGGLAGQYR